MTMLEFHYHRFCNVCASQYAQVVEQDPDSIVLSDFPVDLKVRLIDMAQQHRLPVEEVFQKFVQWKYGRPAQVNLNNKSIKKKAGE
jgi:hypothetical protein